MNNKLNNIGLGILSWKGYDSLTASLESYKKNGLLELFAEKTIYFNEIDSQAKAIAKKYGFTAHGTKENTGIFGGFKGLAQSMESKYILLLENDWQLIAPPATTKSQLEAGINLLKQNKAIKIYYRQRTDMLKQMPAKRFQKFFPPKNSSVAKKARAFVNRTLSPIKKSQIIAASRFYMESPQSYFNFVEYDEKIDFLFYPSKYQNWSNNPFLINRNFFVGKILKRVEKTKTPKRLLVNGFKSIEHELNIVERVANWPLNYITNHKLKKTWWQKQPYKIATSNKGLFKHKRIGNRGY